MYVGELLKNRFLPETLERMLVLIQTLKERDSVEGVILAGTELPLLLTSDSACGIPLLDTTRIHVMAAVEQAWGEQLGSVD
jgi:aspartate racemase